MNLIIKKQSVGVVLAQDLTVWKVGELEDSRFISRYQKFTYPKDAVMPFISLKVVRDERLSVIKQGYHAFVDKELAEMFAKLWKADICEFLIPKDSTVYFCPMKARVVASQIKFVG